MIPSKVAYTTRITYDATCKKNKGSKIKIETKTLDLFHFQN
jgi:hypothetical protein